jgi:hypothetical protein
VKSGKASLQKATAILVILTVVFASISAYSSFVLMSETSRVTQLQTLASNLQNRNNLLENVLSSQAQPVGNPSPGLNPVTIYDISNRSVVTVQSTQVSVVQTFFGPQTSVSSVLGSGFVVDYSNTYYVVTNFQVVDTL